MFGAHFSTDAVYVCEDVSKIEIKNGLFYLTDDLGSFTITRVMRPSTFLKCVKGAYALAIEWSAQSNGQETVKEFRPAP